MMIFSKLTDKQKQLKKLDKKSLSYSFQTLCSNGDLENVKFIIEHKLFSDKYLRTTRTLENGLKYACESNEIIIIDYLLTSNHINVKPNINEKHGGYLKAAIILHSWEAIDKLIFEYDIDFNEDIRQFIDYSEKIKTNNDEINNKVIEKFKLRELNKKLQIELTKNEEIKKPPKI